MPDETWALGVDLGGTKIAMGAVNRAGKIIESLRVATKASEGPAAIEQQISSGVEELSAKMGSAPVGVGIGVAGQVDPNNGVVHFAPNLPGWKNIPLQSDLVKVLGLPVAVLNDVRAATWGEWKHGAGKGCGDFVCVFLGTGIGGGVVSNNVLLSGYGNSAGEIGHMTIDLYGPLCTCGNRGCFEALAGGWAIARSANEAFFLPSASRLPLHADEVIEAAKNGDSIAMAIIDKAFEAIIAGSVGIINAFNPQRLIFGGGLAAGLEVVAEVVDAAVRGRALSAATEKLEVVSGQLGNDAGVIGAATYIILQGDHGN